jgi:hypothetical protein
VREAQSSEDPVTFLNSLKSGALAPDFKEWQSSEPELAIKANQLEGELSKVPDLRERIENILNEQQTGTPIKKEDLTLLEKAQFVGSLHLVMDLSKKVGALKRDR